MKHCRKMNRPTSAGGEVLLGRGKGGDDVWSDTNLTGLKNKIKIHAINLANTNRRWRFKAMMS
jgi:hypothetical protein